MLKTEIELFSQLISFFKDHDKGLIKCFLLSSLFLLAFICIYSFVMPKSFFESAIFIDLSHTIYYTASRLGYNPYYYITIITVYSFLLQQFVSVSTSTIVSENDVFENTLQKSKKIVLPYIVLYLLILACVWVISQLLFALDDEFNYNFSFSFLNIVYFSIPIAIYLIIATLYNNVTSNLTIREFLKKIKLNGSFKNTWLSVLFILIIYLLSKYIIKTIIFFLVALLASFGWFPILIIDLTLIVSDAFLIYFLILYVTFLYANTAFMSDELKMEQLINDIE